MDQQSYRRCYDREQVIYQRLTEVAHGIQSIIEAADSTNPDNLYPI